MQYETCIDKHECHHGEAKANRPPINKITPSKRHARLVIHQPTVHIFGQPRTLLCHTKHALEFIRSPLTPLQPNPSADTKISVKNHAANVDGAAVK